MYERRRKLNECENNPSSFLKMLYSYNSNVFTAALIFLFFVILFVLLLNLYVRFVWSPFHQQLSASRRFRRQRNRIRTLTTTRTIPTVPLGGLESGISSGAAAVTCQDKGLDSSVISSIPLFIYGDNEKEEEEECVICIGLWEVGDFGRKLRNCGHVFHVECIDMWLSSHSTCPLCRSSVLFLPVNDYNSVDEEIEVRLQLFPAGEEENLADDQRSSLTISVMDEDNRAREGEVRVEVFDEEINGEDECRSTSK